MPFNGILIDANQEELAAGNIQLAAGRTIEASIPAHWSIDEEEISKDSGSKRR